jgi:hypothetical protein
MMSLKTLAFTLLLGANQLVANMIVPIANTDLPVTLASNTTYLFTENLDASTVAPTAAFFGNDISQVVIDFAGYSLFVADFQTGIDIENSTDITIKNGLAIANGKSEAVGVSNSQLISIQQVGFVSASTAFADVADLIINECQFSGTYESDVVDFDGTNCIMTHCSFSVTAGADNIFTMQLSGMGFLIDNCTFEMQQGLFLNAARDLLIRKCTIVQSDDQYSLLAQEVHGLTVESCVFDSNGMGNVHIFDDSSDVLLKGSVFQGPSQVAILSDCSARITVDNCSIRAQDVGVELNNSQSCNIVNSRIKDVKGIGVLIADRSSLNEVSECSISNNLYGVVVDRGTKCNLIDNNSIFKNKKCQISLNPKKNKAMDNIVLGSDRHCHKIR